MARSKRWPYTLRELDLFSDCTNSELRRVASLLTAVDIPAGEVLLRERNHAQQFMIIANGQVAVTATPASSARSGGGSARSAGGSARSAGGSTRSGGSGCTPLRLAILGPGDFVGEMALLDRVPRSATVTTLTPVTVYACNIREFFTLLRVAPSVATKITQAAAERRERNADAA